MMKIERPFEGGKRDSGLSVSLSDLSRFPLSNSLGSRSGRSCLCRRDSLRANSYRPSTLTWSSSSGESRSTSSGLTPARNRRITCGDPGWN